RKQPATHYDRLLAWVAQNAAGTLACTHRRSPRLDEALDLELQATELGRGSSANAGAFSKSPVVALLTQAIDKLETTERGRRQQDLLIDLLLRRGNLLLDVKEFEKDYGGARRDALRVLAIDGTIASAHTLLANA